jgi:integrase
VSDLPVPGFAALTELVLSALSSAHTRRAYRHSLRCFFEWYTAAGRPPFDRTLLQSWRAELQRRALAPSSINVSLAAVRRLTNEAEGHGILPPGTAAHINATPGIRQQGIRAGNWLTADQARRLLQSPDPSTTRGKRDRAILSLLLGCALRRAEVAALQSTDIQLRESRWVVPDLLGKGNRLRTVPIPAWVKAAIDSWTAAAPVSSGPLFRAIGKSGKLSSTKLTERSIWHIVRAHAAPLGFPDLAPHDLRRTCAKLCRAAGGDLEQIQFLLGHASILTTERYLGSRQNLETAVNDHLGIEPRSLAK